MVPRVARVRHRRGAAAERRQHECAAERGGERERALEGAQLVDDELEAAFLLEVRRRRVGLVRQERARGVVLGWVVPEHLLSEDHPLARLVFAVREDRVERVRPAAEALAARAVDEVRERRRELQHRQHPHRQLPAEDRDEQWVRRVAAHPALQHAIVDRRLVPHREPARACRRRAPRPPPRTATPGSRSRSRSRSRRRRPPGVERQHMNHADVVRDRQSYASSRSRSPRATRAWAAAACSPGPPPPPRAAAAPPPPAARWRS